MDSLALLGALIAVVAIFIGQTLDGGHINSLLNTPAFLIVVGGSLGATMIQVPLIVFQRAIVMFGWIFFPPTVDWTRTTNKVVMWSEVARKDGILGLDQFISREKDPFSRKAIQLLVDGREPVTIRHTLEIDIDTRENFDNSAAKVFEAMGGYTPTIGILAAVMGLIHVMENLSDPDNLGQGIATAFVATIYGVGLANLLLIPVSRKMYSIVAEKSREKEMIMEGIIGIAAGENPKNIAVRLKSYDVASYAS